MDHEWCSKSEASALAEFDIADSSHDEDLFQQRINEIRMQLDDTYNIFVNARETLSSISFENLGEHLNSDSLREEIEPGAPDGPTNRKITLVRDANNRVDVAKSLESLAKDVSRAPKPVEDIPELNKFFKVISDLTEGIKKINGHQQSITELNDDLNTMGERQTQPSGSGTSLPGRLANMSID